MKNSLFLKRFKKDRLAMTSAATIVLLIFIALFGNFFSPHAYDLQNTLNSLASPGLTHWMGTDELGRDLFSRLIYGTRISMAISLLTAFSALFLGTLYGAVAGYVGGRVDNLMMRAIDVLYAIPDLLLIILMTILIGRV